MFFVACGVTYGVDNLDRPVENDTECYDEREAYAGAYIGAGLSYQYTNNRVGVSDNYADVPGAMAYWTNGKNEEAVSKARSYYFSADNWELNGKSKGKIGGSINVGYGQFVKSCFYLGADFVLDITSNSKSSQKAKRAYKDTTVWNNEVVPTMALRVGGYVPDVDVLICARLGIALVDAKVKNEYLKNEIKVRKIAPVVGLSIEKKVWRNCSVKVEGDYRFSTEKEQRIDGGVITGIQGIAFEKAKTRSYSVRLVGVYHFN